MAEKKEHTGHFKKGNTQGNRYSTTNQPANRGRKPSRYKELLKNLSKIGEPITRDDYNKVIVYLLTMTKEEIQVLVNDSKTPIATVIIASSIFGDISTGQMRNLVTMTDQALAAPKEQDTPTESLYNFDDIPEEKLNELVEAMMRARSKRAQKEAAPDLDDE